MKLAVTQLTQEAFEPFGRVIRMPEDRATASGAGWKWWGEVEQLAPTATAYAFGYLSLRPGDMSFDWAECHQNSQELIIPLTGTCLIYVARASVTNKARGPLPEDFRAFRVSSGEAVLLENAVWHGAPLAANSPLSALVMLQQGTGEQDTEKVSLPRIEISG